MGALALKVICVHSVIGPGLLNKCKLGVKTINFSSKKDVWFTVLVWGFVSFIVLIYIFGGEPVGNQFITYKSIPGYLIGILMVALLLWLWFGAGYQIKGNMLNIRFGPFNKTIKVNDIKKISAVNNSSFSRKLTIHYGEYDVISLSPKNESQFIKFLIDINPDIELSDTIV